jgi:WD40 repeat protein
MGQLRKTFRLFVSSTFSDLKAERNALQERVFPRIRALCQQHGARFQAIDLRWGVSAEASLDQQTMNICLGEIARCQETTPRPNFLILLGDRYGWQPLPSQIPATEFEAILNVLDEENRKLLHTWYHRDDNAVPTEYVLLPRVVGGPFQNPQAWAVEEARLRNVLQSAVADLQLPEVAQIKYLDSATHQEIIHGAMQVDDAEEHVLCFIREIENMPQDKAASDFLDQDEEGHPDQDAAVRLRDLKQQLAEKLGKNVFTYRATWEKHTVSQDHMDQFCEKVYTSLTELIFAEVERTETRDALDLEIAAQHAFGMERTRTFVGRANALEAIETYLSSRKRIPLAVGGASGSGKSALLAQAALQAANRFPQAEVITRFVGATPASSNGRELLASLCLQISQLYELDSSTIPADFRELEHDFKARLSCASEKRPLILFLDALDQLSPGDAARRLMWLPAALPEHVFMVISTVLSDVETNLHNKVPEKSRLTLDAMPAEEAELLLDTWLEGVGRTLQTAQRQEVLSKFTECPQPLYLKLAFEEARRWKSYDGVPSGIDGQTGLSKNIKGMIRDLLSRLSSNTHHGKPIVQHSLSYIASGKHGLTEDELLDVLSQDIEVLTWFLQGLHHIPTDFVRQVRLAVEKDSVDFGWKSAGQSITDESVETWLIEIRNDPKRLDSLISRILQKEYSLRLPVVLWSRLYEDLKPYLTNRAADGTVVLDFYHRQVGEVVNDEIRHPESAADFHQILAEYFNEPDQRRITSDYGSHLRMLVELPYQQAHAHLGDALKTTLTDFPFLHAKTSALGPQQLIEDYNEVFRSGLEEKVLSLLQGAIRLSANVLREDPGQLPGVFLARLMENNDPDIRDFLKEVKKWEGERWLRPRTPGLTSPRNPLLRTLDGHGHPLTAIAALSEAGERVIAAGDDQSLRIWNTDTGELLSEFVENEIQNMAISPLRDKRRIVTGGRDGSLYIWDLEAGKPIRRLEGHQGEVCDLSISSGENYVLSASKDSSLILWDIEGGKIIHRLEGHTGPVNAIDVSPDGQTALSASNDGSLRLWDLESGEMLCCFEGHSTPVTAVAFIGDGNQAISGGFNELQFSHCIKMWDLEAGKEIRTIKDRTWGVHALLDLPEEDLTAAAIADGTIKIIDVNQGYIRQTLEGHVADVRDLALCGKGKQLVSASNDGTLKIWDYDFSDPQEDLFDLALPVDHRRILQRRLTSAPSQTGTSAISVDAMAVFPNRNRAVSAMNIDIGFVASQQYLAKIAEWDLKSGMHIKTFETGGEITAMAVSTDGQQIIGASSNRLLVIDPNSGTTKELHQNHVDRIAAVLFDTDSQHIYSASIDGSLRIWELETSTEITEFQVDEAVIKALALLPDSRRLIIGLADATLQIWDLDSIHKIHTLTGHHGSVNAISVLPHNGSVLSASDDHTLKLWDLETGNLLATLEGHHAAVTGVAVLADGKYAASASVDRSIKIWRLDNGQIMASFSGEGAFHCLAAKPDERFLIAGDELGRTHILQLAGIGWGDE